MSAWTIIGIAAVGAGIMFVGVLLGALIAMPQRRSEKEDDEE